MPRLCLAPFVLAFAANAAAQELKPGDTAPPLAIARWLQGGPVAQFEAGKAYVVVFWAPWCNSCAEHMARSSGCRGNTARMV